MRNKLLNSGASFNLKTTLSGKGIVRFIKLAKNKVNIKENKMQNTYLDRVSEALTLLNRLDNFKSPTTNDGRIVKSYSIKLFILLFTIAKHEGETQAFYSELLNWTTANTSIHTRYLYDNGFIGKAYDDRDTRNLARKLFITPKGREFIENLLRKERS